MKTLKKTLCLVLAVVMAVGVLVLPAYATDFDDDADITHDEAVSVLNGLGIVSGVGNGKFDPEGTFTRGDAAILLTRVLLTPAGAKDLDDTRAIFDDVPVTSNYNKYITWAVEQGHIHGVGDNKFNPTKKLTGVELAALMLEAIGEELPTDGSWKNFVAKKSKDYKLTDNISGYSAGAVITRDDAVQMMYNAMNASPSGEKQWGVYKLDATQKPTGNPVETFDSIVDAAVTADFMSKGSDKYGVKAVEDSDSILATLYDVSTNDDPDVFGRPQYSIVDENNKPLYSKPQAAVKEYYGPVTYKQIYADLGLTKVTSATLYIDGLLRKSGSTDVVQTEDDDTKQNLNTEASGYVGVATKGIYGVETYVYEAGKNDKGVMTYTICQIIPYYATVDKVEGVDTEKSGVKTDTATFILVSPYFGQKKRESTDFVDFAKDDHVILNMTAKDGETTCTIVQDAYELDTVTGTLSRIVTKDGVATYTIGGNEYKACFAHGTLPSTVGSEVTVRVDKHNNIVAGVNVTEPDPTYIYVLAKENVTAGTGEWSDNATPATVGSVYGILSDGTRATLTVKYGGTGNVAESKDVTVENVYEYVSAGNDQVNLKTATDVVADTTDPFTSGSTTAKISGGEVVLNSKTLFVYFVGEGRNLTSFTTNLGNANCGSIAKDAKVLFTTTGGIKVASVVFVKGNYNATVSANEYAYISDNTVNMTKQLGEDGKAHEVYQYTGYKANGDEVTLYSYDDALDSYGLYKFSSTNYVDDDDIVVAGQISGTDNYIVTGTVTEVYGDTLLVRDTSSASAAAEAHYRGFTEGTYVYTGTSKAMKGNNYIGIINASGNFTAIWFYDAE